MNKRILRIKYLRMLNLRNFDEKRGHVIFSCPICGDSERNKRSARGYVLGIDDSEKCVYYCHNCNVSISYKNLLKSVSERVFQLYKDEFKKSLLTQFKNRKKTFKINSISKAPNKPLVDDRRVFKHKLIYNVGQLDKTHTAALYLTKRNIPEMNHKRLFYIDTNPYVIFRDIFGSDKYDDKYDLKINRESIVIPHYNDKNEPIGMTVRNLSADSPIRYIKLMTSESEQYFYNQEGLDWQQKTYILEGQMDVLSFSNNCQIIAMCSTNNKLSTIPKNVIKKNIVYCFDNEYDNKNIQCSINSIAEAGHGVFIWPSEFRCKDFNDLKMTGKSDIEMKKIINNNTYYGKMILMMLCKTIKQNQINHIL